MSLSPLLEPAYGVKYEIRDEIMRDHFERLPRMQKILGIQEVEHFWSYRVRDRSVLYNFNYNTEIRPCMEAIHMYTKINL